MTIGEQRVAPLIFVAALAMSVSACGGRAPESASATELATIEKPIFTPCDDGDRVCSAAAENARADWPAALARNYQAQRNVAYRFASGENVVRNPVQACAWRIIILAADDAQVDASDTANYKLECGRLIPADLEAARATARMLSLRVYGKDIVEKSGLGEGSITGATE